jgi:hypothetical protein
MEFSMNSPREHLRPGYGDGFLGALLQEERPYYTPIVGERRGPALCHSPDRLARNYAYQVLLIDQFQRAGVGVIFSNRELGQSPEDDLLLQVQGMMASYERPKIMERHRRGAHAQWGPLWIPLRSEICGAWAGAL